MSVRKIETLPEASLEVEEAFQWYLERSPQAAESFLLEVDHGIESIAQSPNRWPPFEWRTRRYLLRSFPYSIVYRCTGDEVLVVAVAHHKRKPGYWRIGEKD